MNLQLDPPSIDLIMSCISSASSRVLINGRKSNEFKHSRGLRQGDPMSPYLFNICLEALTGRINETCMSKDWTPFWVGRGRVPISHLLFADDLLLFGRVDENTAFAVRIVLESFCQDSGQKINEAKSKLIFSPYTTNEHKRLFIETLNIEESKDLGMYLGLPISHKRPTRNQVQFIVDKVRSRLANWKTKFLSKAGRMTLISSTLLAIPAYYMQAISLPTSTLHDIDSICNNFLWGEEGGKKKIHLVNKQSIFLPKNQGGLGITCQTLMNRAYMAKLGWKIAQGQPSLAQRCIRAKYMHGDRVTKLKNGSVVWKSIGQGWDLLKENSSWNLGDGRSIDFWHDDWLSIGPLRDWVQGPLTPEEDSRKVNSVVDLGNWDLSSLSIPLPSSLTNRILTMIPPPQDVAADLLIPKFVDHKGFRLQKAYRAQLMYSPSHPDLSWIWKGRCEQKLKFFV